MEDTPAGRALRDVLARMDRKLGPRVRRAKLRAAGEELSPWEDGEDTTRRSLPDIGALPKPALPPRCGTSPRGRSRLLRERGA